MSLWDYAVYKVIFRLTDGILCDLQCEILHCELIVQWIWTVIVNEKLQLKQKFFLESGDVTIMQI